MRPVRQKSPLHPAHRAPEQGHAAVTDPITRLKAALDPERAVEVEAIEAVGTGHAAYALADAVERAMKHAFLLGAEVGRREVEEEHGLARRCR